MPLKQAQGYAAKIVDWLRPYCEHIEIAGSIRRECATCADVDLVCIPRFRKGQNTLRRFFYDYVDSSAGRAHWRHLMYGPGCYGSGP